MKTYPRAVFAPILAAHAAGKIVNWQNAGYKLTGPPESPLVTCTANGHACGLFHASGEVSSYDPATFILPQVQLSLRETLAGYAPSVVLETLWTHDRDSHSDEPGETVWQVEIRATAIQGGQFITGSGYLGGICEETGKDPDVSWYETDLTLEALETLPAGPWLKIQIRDAVEALNSLKP